MNFKNSLFISSLIILIGIMGAWVIHIKTAAKINEIPATVVGVIIDEKKSIKNIIFDTQKLVVQIETPDGIGSGFLYNDKGDIITNAHVLGDYQKVRVIMADSRNYEGHVIGIGEGLDIGLVRVDGLTGTSYLEMMAAKAEMGDEVLAMGSPLGLQNTVTQGIISGVDRDFDIGDYSYENAYQISAPIAPGNSGGPLISGVTGEVIGINSATAEMGNIGFSIPIISVQEIVQGWSDYPKELLDNNSEVDYLINESEELVEMGNYLVNYFYECINYGDYAAAYDLLSSKWKNEQSFEDFGNGYARTMFVGIDSMENLNQGDKAVIICLIYAEEKNNNGEVVYNKYRTTYTVGYENNALKLLDGAGKIIK